MTNTGTTDGYIQSLEAEVERLRAAIKDAIYRIENGWPDSALMRLESVIEQSAVSRCEVTGNPVGTDTWAVGHDCQCAPCQRMLREGAAAR